MTNTDQAAEQTTGLATVEILRAPVRIWVDASERYQDLLREFTLMQLGHAEGHSVPSRLLRLSEELTGRYAGLMANNYARRDQALAAGQDQIDLTYQVPVEIVEPCRHLTRMLAEVDEFCEADQMLTLATPATQQAFRVWFLGEFADQINGAAPKPWTGPLDCTEGCTTLQRG